MLVTPSVKAIVNHWNYGAIPVIMVIFVWPA